MPDIITCECGSKIRLPEDKANRMFRCPVCKVSIALTIDAQVLPAARLGAKAAGVVCPICQSEIGGDEPAVPCPACDQVHHSECWSTIGGCGTYGCAQAPALPKTSPQTQNRPPGGWGDVKRCPSCGEDIKSSALKCRHCGAKFDTAEPLSARELKKRRTQNAAASQFRVVLPGLFVLSVPGCLAPVILVIGGILLATRQTEVRKAGPVYMVLGYAAVIVSAIYTLLMLAFAAYSIAK